MPEWVRWLLAALAVYRVAQLLTIDDGPWRLFGRLRDAAGVYDRGGDGRPRTEFGRLLACPYCAAVWVALPAAALALWPTLIGDVLLAWLGLAGFQDWAQGPRRVK